MIKNQINYGQKLKNKVILKEYPQTKEVYNKIFI